MGARFGRWTTIGPRRPGPYPGHSTIRCRCVCGVERDVLLCSLRSGRSSSCGCFERDVKTTHGQSQSGGAYSSWQAMKTRCLNKKSKDFERYGACGIKVCDRWLKFENFFEDMGPRPSGTELERKDNDGHYEPGNCRWASDQEQANNRSNNTRIRGKTIAEWSRETGISPSTLGNRRAVGLSDAEVLGPLKRRRKKS